MLFLSLFKWWYGAGWRRRALLVNGRLEGVMDYFSIGLLLRTLFSPFRQISAGRVDGPLGVQLHALADKLISRVIGAMVRLVILIVGLITIALNALFGVFILAAWAFVPALPIIGLVLAIVGWTI